jgi:hypothetical protein
MKKIILALLVLSQACSQWRVKERSIAGLIDESQKIEAKLGSEIIFPNGANAVRVQVNLPQSTRADDIRIISDSEIRWTPFRFNGEHFFSMVTPILKSPDIKLLVIYKNQKYSSILKLQTTLGPLKDRIENVPWAPNSSSYVSGMSYTRRGSMPEGLYEGFRFGNNGPNSIVPSDRFDHSQRTFDFRYDQQAQQNINMMFVDSPNSTTSHSMYSHMMIFPRLNMPFVEITKDRNIVTLPNGEEMIFDSKTNTIIDGVFEEGPVDVGPDRFTRHYPDLRYKGQGILLRANARGQLPQEGQFESTKIDMEYGVRFSADVLIINGYTGQRCRRPKSDFWGASVNSNIDFKFPTDEEFDRYLKLNCDFGIPSMPGAEIPEKPDTRDLAMSIWSQCENKPSSREASKNFILNASSDSMSQGLRNCLNLELERLESDKQQSAAFDLYFVYLEKKQDELSRIDSLVGKELELIKAELTKDYQWIKDPTLRTFDDECLKQSQKSPRAFIQLNPMPLSDKAQKMCQEIRSLISQITKQETSQFTDSILHSLTWEITLDIKSNMRQECMKELRTLIKSDFKFSHLPEIYETEINLSCEKVENSERYLGWIADEVKDLEEKILKDIRLELNRLAINKAKSCLVTYPTNNSINRIRFKFQRDKCLTDSWSGLEKNAVSNVFRQGIVREWLAQSSIERKVQLENRSLQQQIMNEYFK